MRALYQPVDLSRFTADIAGVFRSAIEKAGLEFTTDCPPIPEPIYVDGDMWEKIVLNLLSNAFKFTLRGFIRLRLVAMAGRVALEVTDSGAGIDEIELPRIFDRFHRVEGTPGRTHEGSGIGLALVQELVKLHGGEIRVRSCPGAGSTFTVEIPAGNGHLPPEQVGTYREAATESSAADVFLQEALQWLPAEPEGETQFPGATIDTLSAITDQNHVRPHSACG